MPANKPEGYSQTPGSPGNSQEPSSHNNGNTQTVTRQGIRRYRFSKGHGYSPAILRDRIDDFRGVSGKHKGVLSAMASHYPNCWLSVQTISDESGYGKTSVRASLRFWKAQGLIEPVGNTKGGVHGSTQYRFKEWRFDELAEQPDTLKSLPVVKDKRPFSWDRNPSGGDGLNPSGGDGLTHQGVMTSSLKGVHTNNYVYPSVGSQRAPDNASHGTSEAKTESLPSTDESVSSGEIATQEPSEQRNPPSPEVSASGPPPNSGPPPSQDELVDIVQELAAEYKFLPAYVAAILTECAGDIEACRAVLVKAREETWAHNEEEAARERRLLETPDPPVRARGDGFWDDEPETANEEWPEDDQQSRFLAGEDVQ